MRFAPSLEEAFRILIQGVAPMAECRKRYLWDTAQPTEVAHVCGSVSGSIWTSPSYGSYMLTNSENLQQGLVVADNIEVPGASLAAPVELRAKSSLGGRNA